MGKPDFTPEEKQYINYYLAYCREDPWGYLVRILMVTSPSLFFAIYAFAKEEYIAGVLAWIALMIVFVCSERDGKRANEVLRSIVQKYENQHPEENSDQSTSA